MAIMSDPDSVLVDNADLLRSIRTTKDIAEQIIDNTTTQVTKAVQAQADDRRSAAVRDTVLVLAAIAVALLIVLLMARALVKPLRMLRDGALKVAHTDLEGEIDRVRAGAEPVPEPLAVYTTEEIGQVAHAVDELHTQALLLAGDEARLRLLVNDMFETMSRRSRSLVDQQLALIDRLERDEEDPERLDNLFRLDHLAARLRRTSANLLVLADAQIGRDQRDPVPLATVINAAVSEVEDYRRVETGAIPDCTVLGSAAGGVIHLLAELIDNALRYSPPNTKVKVSAVRGSEGGVLLRIADSGLGMTDSDRRMANMRLQPGGTPDPTPENARHMGLFVVGRLASRYGLRVGLRGPSTGESGTGTTAEVYLPLATLVEGQQQRAPAPPPQRQFFKVTPPAAPEGSAGLAAAPGQTGGLSVTSLPRRSPGSSGITAEPGGPAPAAQQREPEQSKQKRPLPTPWWEKGSQSQPPPAPPQQPAKTASDTSAFFARRPSPKAPKPAAKPVPAAKPAEPPDLKPSGPDDDDVIYQRMLSEIMGDPHDLVQSPDLDWKTVWDRGWTAAAEAEERPVEAHTEHGLPMRTPERGWCRARRRQPRNRPTADSIPIPTPSVPPSGAISAVCAPGGRRPGTAASRGPSSSDRPILLQPAGLAGVEIRARGPRCGARAAGVGRRVAGRGQRAPAARAGRPAGRGGLRAGQPGHRRRATVRGRAGAAVGGRDAERLPAADARG